jgi:hypothetical protein
MVCYRQIALLSAQVCVPNAAAISRIKKMRPMRFGIVASSRRKSVSIGLSLAATERRHDAELPQVRLNVVDQTWREVSN